jgi:hypothetical protein
LSNELNARAWQHLQSGTNENFEKAWRDVNENLTLVKGNVHSYLIQVEILIELKIWDQALHDITKTIYSGLKREHVIKQAGISSSSRMLLTQERRT